MTNSTPENTDHSGDTPDPDNTPKTDNHGDTRVTHPDEVDPKDGTDTDDKPVDNPAG